MRNLVLQSMSVVAGIGLLCTTPALADPLTVTTGPGTAQPNGGGPFTLAGDGVSLSFSHVPRIPVGVLGAVERPHDTAAEVEDTQLSGRLTWQNQR
jgi:hypothetical protein